MDQRRILSKGTVLSFPGMECRIEECIGRGSNALVYGGVYTDATNSTKKHHVLIKELFPYDPQGSIWRDEKNNICRNESSESTWLLHKASFERGNEVHLDLLSQRPDKIGGNVNTFPLNNTFYTVLDGAGSKSLDRVLNGQPDQSLKKAAGRIIGLLDALDVFHRRGYLHLDISLDNTLIIGLEDQERVTLIDYNSSHTIEEIQCGEDLYFSAKEGFTSPEVMTGMRQLIGESTDLYSVTAVFFSCLMGHPPTTIELNQRFAPDAQKSILLADAPETVKAQVKSILRKGLNILPDKRFQSCQEMRKELVELINRIDGLGVSHAALWEAGRRIVQRLVKHNPSLAYANNEKELYPQRIMWQETGEEANAISLIKYVSGSDTRPILLTGAGGLGKTTVLYRTVLSSSNSFSSLSPALMYISLMKWRPGKQNYIIDSTLHELKFASDTRTMDDARHKLLELLSQAIPTKNGEKPLLIYLLDGLNEAQGDLTELVKEIDQLSSLPGVRIILTSRSIQEGLNVNVVKMLPLRSTDVDNVLSRNGLLQPISSEMNILLQTPLMLSIMIRTAKSQNTQVFCNNQRELIAEYLDALCNTTNKEKQEERFQIETAIYVVLPAIANEITKKKRPLGDAELLEVVSKCRKQLNSRVISKAFPKWIGHGSEIIGSRDTGDETWFGIMVQQLLWRRLGLLTRDENGKYNTVHEIIRDELLARYRENRILILKSRVTVGFCISSVACIVILLGVLAYEIFFKPIPYDDFEARNMMDYAQNAYLVLGLEYKKILELVDTTNRDAREYEDKLAQYNAGKNYYLSYDANYINDLKAAIDKDIEGNIVEKNRETYISWSRKPFDIINFINLIQLPIERREEYDRLIDLLTFCVSNKSRMDTYLDEYRKKLNYLISIDAKINAALYQLVCGPHLVGEYEENESNTYYHNIITTIPKQETIRTENKKNLTQQTLDSLKEEREDVITEINNSVGQI